VTYVPQVKNAVNSQFGTVSNADFTPTIIGAPGDGMAPLLDAYGRLIVLPATPFGPTDDLPVYEPQQLETDAVINPALSQLYQFHGYNPNGFQVFIQAFDSAVAPTTGVTLSYGLDLLVPAQSSFAIQQFGLFYATGLAWGVSTTPVTWTNDGSVFARFIARYGA
jgi:hypothetical protein